MPVNLFTTSKEWLVSDKARVSLSQDSREFLTATKPAANPILLVSTSREFLYRPLDMLLFQESKEVLMVLDAVPTVHARASQVRELAWQHAVWPTVANTISTETVYSVSSAVLHKSSYSFPQSQTAVAELVQAILRAAAPDMPTGPEQVNQLAQMVLQSDNNAHVSVSMDYVMSVAEIVLRSQPLAMFKSDITARSVAQKVLRKTPMGFLPQSDTRVRQVAFEVIQALPSAFLPQSNTVVSEMSHLVMVEFHSPVPDQGVDEVREVRQAILQQATAAAPRSVTSASQAAEMVLQASPLSVQSTGVVVAAAQLAFQKSDYPLPEAMTGVYGYQIKELAVTGANYSSADLYLSQMAVGQAAELVLRADPQTMPQVDAVVNQAALMWNIQSTYPRPGDMVPPSRAAIVPSVTHLTLQKSAVSAIQSMDRVGQVAHVSLQHAAYDTPEDMFNKGLFVWQVFEQNARQATFPDPSDMHSAVRADIVVETLAKADTSFPDPTVPPTDGEAYVSMVVEQQASVAEYPDPSGGFSVITADQVSLHVAEFADYPDTSLPLGDAEITQVFEQSASPDEFPDPVSRMSPANADLIAEQLAQPATYSDPAKTGSNLTAYQVLEMVAVRDNSLNGVPDYVFKHRPVITVNIVYSTKT